MGLLPAFSLMLSVVFAAIGDFPLSFLRRSSIMIRDGFVRHIIFFATSYALPANSQGKRFGINFGMWRHFHIRPAVLMLKRLRGG